MSSSTNSGYLLDTNAAIAILRQEAEIEALLHAVTASVSIITVGELQYGVENSGNIDKNRTKLDAFIANRTVIYCDLDTARIYGRVTIQLQRKGRPNQPNDIWIASLALQHHLILLTRDAHFQNVTDLTVTTW